MKITKYGHCCLLIEENGKRILTDPGNYTTEQEQVKNIDIILITHEHADHLHIDSLKKTIVNNPQAKIVTNSSVGKLLEAVGISYALLEDGQSSDEWGIHIEGYGTSHVEIYKEFGQVLNTGYFIGTRLFYPGDAYYNPPKPVEILALPVAGPWCKVKDVIDYALTVRPKVCFPVHDGGLKQAGLNYRIPTMILEKEGIKFVPIELNKETEF